MYLGASIHGRRGAVKLNATVVVNVQEDVIVVLDATKTVVVVNAQGVW